MERISLSLSLSTLGLSDSLSLYLLRVSNQSNSSCEQRESRSFFFFEKRGEKRRRAPSFLGKQKKTHNKLIKSLPINNIIIEQ